MQAQRLRGERLSRVWFMTVVNWEPISLSVILLPQQVHRHWRKAQEVAGCRHSLHYNCVNLILRHSRFHIAYILYSPWPIFHYRSSGKVQSHPIIGAGVFHSRTRAASSVFRSALETSQLSPRVPFFNCENSLYWIIYPRLYAWI